MSDPSASLGPIRPIALSAPMPSVGGVETTPQGAAQRADGVVPIDPNSALLHPSVIPTLGIYTKYAATLATSGKTPNSNHYKNTSCLHRFSLQEGARKLVPHERVARCYRYLRNGETHVELLHSPSQGRAHYGSVEVCGSVWLCPLCATKIAEERRRELLEAVAAVNAAGGGMLHATFTVRHGRGDDLAQLLDAFTAAYRRLTGHRTYRQGIKPKYQLFGSVRALEVTHGESGWHPHYHVLLFLSHPLEPEKVVQLETELRALWASAAAKSGLDMNAHGLQLTATQGAIADYIAKYGRDPKLDPWGPESELTKAHVKRGKAGGSTPWDLLRAYQAGDKRAGALWIEYAGVFKGRQQLVWSPHLRALLGLEDETSDEKAAAQLPDDAVHLVWVKFSDWLLVLRYRARGELLNVASAGDVAIVRSFLDELRSLRLLDRRRRGLEPSARPARPRQLTLWSSPDLYSSWG